MNTDISTIEQFDRAKKRLSKALLPYADLPLHACAQVLAQTLGARNVHEAQQHLHASEGATESVEQVAAKVVAAVHQYVPAPEETLSWALTRFGGAGSMVSLNVLAFHRTNGDEEGFGVFFEARSSYGYVDKEMAALQLSDSAVALIERVRSLMLSVPIHLRPALGWECLKQAGHWTTEAEFERLSGHNEVVFPLLAARTSSMNVGR